MATPRIPGPIRSAARELLRSRSPLQLRSRLRLALKNAVRRAQGLPSEEIERWEERARNFGARAVFNLGHSEGELLRVTELQKSQLYPKLREHLLPTDRVGLDLGCGTGRFTADLAAMTGDRAFGVDPIQSFLDLAPRSPAVEYRLMSEGRIPLEDGAVDVAWICLVLGGLREKVLLETVNEVRRVLRPGGLVFLVENTTQATDSAIWHFRTVAEYQRLFRPVPLELVHQYTDLGETISVLVGRAKA